MSGCPLDMMDGDGGVGEVGTGFEICGIMLDRNLLVWVLRGYRQGCRDSDGS